MTEPIDSDTLEWIAAASNNPTKGACGICGEPRLESPNVIVYGDRVVVTFEGRPPIDAVVVKWGPNPDLAGGDK